ncbi:MAG: 4'-phosphopantetheinyl transferase superfamily protein, partial [Paraperlucidibaca sp.]
SRHYLALAIAPRELLDGASNNDNSLANTPENVAGVLGIDIELLGRARAREALAAHYYHPNEHALATSELGFLTIWTRKEAIVKAHGIGLRISLKSLNTATDIVDHSQLGRWQCNSFSLQEHSHEIAVLSLSWPATRKP